MWDSNNLHYTLKLDESKNHTMEDLKSIHKFLENTSVGIRAPQEFKRVRFRGDSAVNLEEDDLPPYFSDIEGMEDASEDYFIGVIPQKGDVKYTRVRNNFSSQVYGIHETEKAINLVEEIEDRVYRAVLYRETPRF